MKLLSDILYKTGLVETQGSTNVAITAMTFDSRKVEKDGLFVAVRGTQSDGHDFIDKAISLGAVAIVCEEFPKEIIDRITYAKVVDSSLALGIIASNFYDNPSSSLKLIGVTGTNGKTTTVTLLFQLFRAMGLKAGMLTTVRNMINSEEIPSTHTTPDAVELNTLLRRMVDAGCKYAFMEVSSHSVVQKRIAGLEFSGGVFSNITHDHLDYHKTFDEYIKAKKTFFDQLPKSAFALVNKDDVNGIIMVQNTKALKRSYSISSLADFNCRVLENQFSGLQLNMDNVELWSKLIGSFNAYNLLAVYSTAILLGQDKMNVLMTISTLDSVEGRFEYVRSDSGITGIVDYAHSPDALKNVLSTIKDIRSGNEQVITVVGCGGDRDSAKRPIMSRIACDLSDRVILTSDNPRSEDPESILKQMQNGIEKQNTKKTLSIVDRREAIRTAVALARPGDIVLVAGKGHEKYQEVNGVKYPFDDMGVLKENLNNANV
ncbi:MAG: UDP-N-acetylmuramoyl-L-alanyl-D-glutamate--2,6-diaminopimelate ligase [Bacteroidetes bacterium]|nr:UDP-N-acetylmuramoyl-L-alanyl-D-glutamate--2,6-diaminopimelate ligase [Bacteroidota bacterium]PHX82190.1 MAG: UDP-N-acetylmuramoyl-L-alanyl-D-glutamate--2,6-diaminopimelate ligase [Flavobacteriales bacterium]